MLPHASVAVHVRRITRAAPQFVVTLSLKPSETDPQPSLAVAVPVTFVLVSVAGHSRVMFVGQVMVGGVVSLTVIVWTQLDLLPQASVAVHVRAMVLAAPQFVVTKSL
jgi:hypothetical protein